MKKVLIFIFLLLLPIFTCSNNFISGDLNLINKNFNKKITLEMNKSDIFEVMGEPIKIETNLFSEKDITSLSYGEIIFLYKETTESLIKIIVLGPSFLWKDITIGSSKTEINNHYSPEYLLDGQVYDSDEKKYYNSIIIRFADSLGIERFKADQIYEHQQEIYQIEFVYNLNEEIEKIELKKTIMWVGLPPIN